METMSLAGPVIFISICVCVSACEPTNVLVVLLEYAFEYINRSKIYRLNFRSFYFVFLIVKNVRVNGSRCS